MQPGNGFCRDQRGPGQPALRPAAGGPARCFLAYPGPYIIVVQRDLGEPECAGPAPRNTRATTVHTAVAQAGATATIRGVPFDQGLYQIALDQFLPAYQILFRGDSGVQKAEQGRKGTGIRACSCSGFPSQRVVPQRPSPAHGCPR